MMLNIDIGTLIVVIVAGHAFAGLLGGFYLTKRKKDATLYTFLLARFLDAFAWTLLGLRGCIPNWLSVLVGNPLLMAGSVLQIVSFLSVKGRLTPQLKRMCYTIALLFLLLFQLALSLYSTRDTMRVAIISFAMAALWSVPVYFSLRDKSASPLQKLITFVYGMGIIFLILRGVGAILLKLPMILLSNHLFNILFFLWLYLITLVGNIGLILLSKEKADLILTKAATYDELTDLYNRRAFFIRAKECLAFCARQQTPVSFFIMDLDHFKKINDFYGHIVGDMVIKNFAVTIKRQLRGYDILGRIGGEEFTALLPGVAEQEACGIAQRLRGSVEKNVVDNAIKYTVSIGIATLVPDECTTIEELYERGDAALYEAKQNGRNQIGIAKEES